MKIKTIRKLKKLKLPFFCALGIIVPLSAPLAETAHSLANTYHSVSASTPSKNENANFNLPSCYLVPDDTYYVKYSDGSVYSRPYDNYVYFYICFDEYLTEDVTVYYHTENWTAVKDVDYFPCVNGTNVTIKSSQGTTKVKEVKLSVQLKNEHSPFSLNDVTRDFKVVIDKAIGDSGYQYPLILEEEKRNVHGKEYNVSDEVFLSLYGKTKFTAELNRNKAGDEFLQITDFNNPLISFTNDYFQDKNTMKRNPQIFHDDPYNWLERIVLTGMGHAYGSADQPYFDASRTGRDIERSFGNYKFVYGGPDDEKFDGRASGNKRPEYRSGEGFTLYTETGYYAQRFSDLLGAIKNNSKYGEIRYYAPASSDLAKLNKIEETFIPKQVRDNMEFYNDYYEVPWLRIADCDTKDNFGWGMFFYAQDWATKVTKVECQDLLLFAVLDDVNPSVANKSSDSYEEAVWLDKSMITTENKLRISLRFSEPIKDYEKTSITATVDRTFDKNVYFFPVKNQRLGSDTIIYEADLNSDLNAPLAGTNIQSITLGGLDNHENITDFGQNGGNHLSKWTYDATFSINVDKRIPSITADEEEKTSLRAAQSLGVQLNVNSMVNGTLYYQFKKANPDGSAPEGPASDEDWLTSDTQGNIYSDSIEIKDNSSMRPSIVQLPSGEQYNGLYYLYAKATSEFGMTGTINNEGKSYFGPYLVDNIAPEVSFTMDPNSDATSRTFILNIKDKNPINSVVLEVSEKNVAPYNEGKATLYVEEDRPLPTSVSIYTEGGVTQVTAGYTLQLYASIFPENAREGVVWSLTDESKQYARINPNTGLLTADAPGPITVNVKTTYGSATSSIGLNVVASPKLLSSPTPENQKNTVSSPLLLDVPIDNSELRYYMDDNQTSSYIAKTTLTFESIVNRWFSVNDTPLISLDMDDFAFKFYVTDSAGNTTDYVTYKDDYGHDVKSNDFQSFFFSKKPCFNATMTTDSPRMLDVPDLDLYSINSEFVFKGDLADKTEQMTVSVNGSEFRGSYTDPNNIEINNETANELHLTLSKSGYYEIILERNGCYSDKFSFYLTDGFKESTQNYTNSRSKELLLNNKVYEYTDNTALYYIATDNTIKKEYYCGTSSPVFSSQEAASRYITYKEYEDFHIETLTNETASLLNQRSNQRYIKANGETVSATAGQSWIRYKNSSWTTQSESVNAWGWYYYGPKSTSIDVTNLPINLTNAVKDAVSKLMVGQKETYLVDEDHTNSRTGQPSLTAQQIEVSHGFILSQTKSGDPILGTGNTLVGTDTNLFKNSYTTKINGKDTNLPIATNLPLTFENNNYLFIAPYNNNQETEYTRIIGNEGMYLKEATDSENSYGQTGVYSIIEVDEFGANKYLVFLDRDFPKINIKTGDSDLIPIENGTNNNYYGSSITICSADNSTETDDKAFVAVYQGTNLYAFNYVKSWDKDINLDNGIYTVIVGDRSGNNYAFKCFVNSEDIEVTAKGGVGSRCTFNITNRENDELRRFDVYYNGTLIDNKLEVSKQFTQNGNYSFIIEDVYGCIYEGKDIEFRRDLPEIEWAYLDELGNPYSYTPGTINRMYIESRADYNYVAASTLTRIKIISENVSWRITGCDSSAYTVNKDGNIITFNSPVSYTFEVWYNGAENDIAKYVCEIDNIAPTINGSYYTYNIEDTQYETFDFEHNTSRELSYEIETTATQYNINNLEKITAEYVKVLVSDGTKIKDITVYLDGKVIDQISVDPKSLNEEIEIFINGDVGNYQIVATDIFDTSNKLEFEIREKKLGITLVDNIEIPSSEEIVYGNSSVNIDVLPGNTVVILITKNGETKPYLYDVQNGKILEGLYFTESYEDPITFEVETSASQCFLNEDLINDVIIYGNSNLESFGNPELIKIINHEYYEKSLDIDGYVIGTNYDVLEELQRYTGSVWKVKKINEQSVTNWQNIYYKTPEIPEGEIDAISQLYYKKLTYPYTPDNESGLRLTRNNDGSLHIQYTQGEEKAFIEIRIMRRNESVNHYKVELSKEITELVFTENNKVLPNKNGYIYCDKEVSLLEIPLDISNMYICYNPTVEEFNENNFIPFTSGYKFKGEGFYKIVGVNIYGNECSYIIVANSTIPVTVIENFTNKDSENYQINYSDTYYANKSIQLVGYNMIEMSCTNGGTLTKDGEKSTLSFATPGEYTVKLVSNNNVTKYVTIIIDNSNSISFNEDWLIGYNENALKKSEGYTNQQLTIDLDENDLNNQEITQIFYIYNGKKVVLYGYDNETGFINYNVNNLTNCIGKNGDGLYSVYFSNKYGDICLKEINYASNPTLIITRTTTQAIESEEISLQDAIENGVWSNSSISFSSTLYNEYYEFMVKSGDDSGFSKESINFPFYLTNVSSNGSVYYTVTYLDAYGNYYEIKVNLLKRDLSFSNDNLNVITYDNSKYTKDNFSFEYDESDVTIVYTLNNGPVTSYKSGEILFKDGSYSIQMYDKAGNRTILNLTKDSVVNFRLEIQDQNQNVEYGTVVNANAILFKSEESTRINIISVKLNGETITLENNTFTKTGNYEILVEDYLGNLRYFTFVLINNELSSFDYIVSDNYIIVAAYYTNKDGIKSTCLEKIENSGTYLNLLNANDGNYEIQLKNKYDNSLFNFTVTIDNSIPEARLVGCSDGDTTTNEILIDKLELGDNIEIYKDDKLINKSEYSGIDEIGSITEGGRYRIKITNKAGVSVEYSFTKLTIANPSLSALILIGLMLISGGFFLGLIFRSKTRSDK